MRPPEPVHGSPHRRLAQLLPLVLRPPSAVLQHRGIGGGLQAGTQDGLGLAADRARATRDRLARERAGRALLHHRPFDRVHRDSKPASGFSHGLTVGHRSHQAFFQVGRIGTHTRRLRIIRALHISLQVALVETFQAI